MANLFNQNANHARNVAIGFRAGWRCAMPTLELNKRQFDARPDRVDFRDQLLSRPADLAGAGYPHPSVVESVSGEIRRRRHDSRPRARRAPAPASASPPAVNVSALGSAGSATMREARGRPGSARACSTSWPRLYDEWLGEDYDGSSCRGAMKGWHHHGVCDEALAVWKRFDRAYGGRHRTPHCAPLGARLSHQQALDRRHAGGDPGGGRDLRLGHRCTRAGGQDLGRAAGDRRDGSRGPAATPSPSSATTPTASSCRTRGGRSWGFRGFAVLTYADWVKNGMDAWVAVMGAPVVTRGTAIAVNRDAAATAADNDAWDDGAAGRRPAVLRLRQARGRALVERCRL